MENWLEIGYLKQLFGMAIWDSYLKRVYLNELLVLNPSISENRRYYWNLHIPMVLLWIGILHRHSWPLAPCWIIVFLFSFSKWPSNFRFRIILFHTNEVWRENVHFLISSWGNEKNNEIFFFRMAYNDASRKSQRTRSFQIHKYSRFQYTHGYKYNWDITVKMRRTSFVSHRKTFHSFDVYCLSASCAFCNVDLDVLGFNYLCLNNWNACTITHFHKFCLE